MFVALRFIINFLDNFIMEIASQYSVLHKLDSFA